MPSDNTLRNIIRAYVKTNPIIESNLGQIELKKNTIGEGGTALVYTDKNEKFALKILVENITSKESNVYKRFKQEFFNLRKLSETDNRIVKFYDFGNIEFEDEEKVRYKIPFILMKKYEKSLKSFCKDYSPQTLDELEEFTEKIIDIVESIHSRSIIHRDLKPDNIFVTSELNYVLGDFGISWFDEKIYLKLAKTKKGDRLANLEFSAPEQFKKGTIPEVTMGLFAIGQLIQWYATGKTIKGLGTDKISDRLGSESYVFDLAVEKLVQENPNDRIQSINELRSFIVSEKINSKHTWLRHSNKTYDQICESIKDWEASSIIPSGYKIESLLANIDQQLIPSNHFVFLVGSLFWQVNESDYIDYIVNLQLDDFTNYENEDIFFNFEISFDRLLEDHPLFNFQYFEGKEFRAATDQFDIYDMRQNYRSRSCLYSEINHFTTNTRYKLLIWPDNGVKYRLSKSYT